MAKSLNYLRRIRIMICPRCKGNGYFKVKQDLYTKKDIVVQCPQCKSKGEIEDENPSYDYSGIDANKLQ